MSDKSEALRLADLIERFRSPDCGYAAAELRRLHAANIDCMDHFNALMAERNELLSALKMCAAVCAGETLSKNSLILALEKASAAIKKATEGQS